ncbi:hypothetical protein RugamoR64_16270 [Duganella rhizosphaerae]
MKCYAVTGYTIGFQQRANLGLLPGSHGAEHDFDDVVSMTQFGHDRRSPLSYVTYSGFDLSITWLLDQIKGNVAALPADVVSFLAWCWIDKAIGMIFSAYSAALVVKLAGGTSLTKLVTKKPRCMAWVHPDQSKTRRAIAVPLNHDAMRVLSLQAGRHRTHVFAFKGETTVKVSTAAWKKALKRAGIDDFRWHDLRHTWASWHVQNGTPLNVLQELGGWESSQMVRRYAHFSAAHLAAYAEVLPSLMVGSVK